jgi:hypothetical protein
MASAVHVPYVADDGTTYQRKTLDDLATALGLTPEALGAHPKVPSNIKVRYRLGKDPATGREHKLRGIPIASTLWTTATTVTVPDPNNRGGATLTLDLAAKVGERTYFR